MGGEDQLFGIIERRPGGERPPIEDGLVALAGSAWPGCAA
jgi:hypothetical protein